MKSKYLFFFPTFGGGGAEKVFITICNELVSAGLPLGVIVARHVGELKNNLSPNIPITNLQSSKTVFSAIALFQFIRRTRPKVVVSFSITTNFLLCLGKALGIYTCRVIISERAVFSDTMKHSSFFVRKIFPLFLKHFYKYADHVVCVSEDVRIDLKKFISFDDVRVSTINNPMLTTSDRTHFCSIKKVRGRRYLIAVGRLHAQKNYDLLIDSFAELVDEFEFNLVICGEGPERGYLEQKIKSLQLEERIFLLGYREKVNLWIGGASMFLSASLWEGLPGALIQAVSAGKPIVALNCRGGVHEILEGGRFGCLVPINSPEMFTHTLRHELNKVQQGGHIPDVKSLNLWRQRYAVSARVRDYLKIIDPMIDK